MCLAPIHAFSHWKSAICLCSGTPAGSPATPASCSASPVGAGESHVHVESMMDPSAMALFHCIPGFATFTKEIVKSTRSALCCSLAGRKFSKPLDQVAPELMKKLRCIFLEHSFEDPLPSRAGAESSEFSVFRNQLWKMRRWRKTVMKMAKRSSTNETL